MDKWLDSRLPADGWPGRFGRLKALVEPVRADLHQYLGEFYVELFNGLAHPDNLDLLDSIRLEVLELGGFEQEATDMDGWLDAFRAPEAAPHGTGGRQPDGHGPDDGHDH
jgi:hypothetical protein